MTDISKRGPDCDDDCEGERGERGKRGKRGHDGERGEQGERGHDGKDGRDGATGPSEVVHDETLVGSGTPGDPLGVNTGPTYGLGPTIQGILQPEFQSPEQVITIYARTFGSDATGDGSLANPYQTMQHAVRDVPAIVPSGVRYIVDITGITEVLPLDYELPAWKAPEVFNEQITDQFWPITAAVAIEADPQLMAAISAADATIAPGDAVPTSDPVTGLITLTLTGPPRGSWANDALKGKFLVDTDPAVPANAVIFESQPTFLRYTNTVLPAGVLQVMEPSAWLQVSSAPFQGNSHGGLNAINIDSLALNGLKITKQPLDQFGLVCIGNGFVTVQMCELEAPQFNTFSLLTQRMNALWIRGGDVASAPSGRVRFQGPFTLQRSLIDAVSVVNLFSPVQAHFRWVVADGCGTINAARSIFAGSGMFLVPADLFFVEQSLIRNGTSHGLQFNGGRARIFSTDIYNNAGDGFRCSAGPGYAELLNVGTSGTPNGGVGVRVIDGVYVQVDLLTDTTQPAAGRGLRGLAVGAEIKVGVLPNRTWFDFTTVAPIRNQFDLVGMNVGATDQSTGSRLYRT